MFEINDYKEKITIGVGTEDASTDDSSDRFHEHLHQNGFLKENCTSTCPIDT